MSSYVTAEYHRIPYRMRRRETPNEDGSFTWIVEYKQARNYDWGPRGTLTERDGKFTIEGRVYDDPYSALWARARSM